MKVSIIIVVLLLSACGQEELFLENSELTTMQRWTLTCIAASATILTAATLDQEGQLVESAVEAMDDLVLSHRDICEVKKDL